MLILTGGAIAGSFIMGLYLFVSLNCFGYHVNEAFSSLRIQDRKHFLQLKIDANGDLTIYPIGIRRVMRRWEEQEKGDARFVPAEDAQVCGPELIEPPIVISRSGDQACEDDHARPRLDEATAMQEAKV